MEDERRPVKSRISIFIGSIERPDIKVQIL